MYLLKRKGRGTAEALGRVESPHRYEARRGEDAKHESGLSEGALCEAVAALMTFCSAVGSTLAPTRGSLDACDAARMKPLVMDQDAAAAAP